MHHARADASKSISWILQPMNRRHSSIRRKYETAWNFRLRSFLLYHTEANDFKGSWRLNRLIRSFSIPNGFAVRRTRFGFTLIIEPSKDPYQKQIYEFGCYEPATLDLMSKLLRRGDIFLDVGANIGLMTLHAANLVGSEGKVYSFEPQLKIFDRLKDNVFLNEFENCFLALNALGDRDDERPIYDYPNDNIGRASLIYSPGGIKSNSVEVTTLDHFASLNKLKKINMVKIDVEGFEYQVISGGKNYIFGNDPPILCVELSILPNEGNNDRRKTYQFIMDSNIYESYKFYPSKFAREARLMPISSTCTLSDFDNVIFVPKKDRANFPKEIFTQPHL